MRSPQVPRNHPPCQQQHSWYHWYYQQFWTVLAKVSSPDVMITRPSYCPCKRGWLRPLPQAAASPHPDASQGRCTVRSSHRSTSSASISIHHGLGAHADPPADSCHHQAAPLMSHDPSALPLGHSTWRCSRNCCLASSSLAFQPQQDALTQAAITFSLSLIHI